MHSMDASQAANAPRARSIGSRRSTAGGSAAIRSTRPVAPEACAANVSLRLATRSSCLASPQTSSTTAPTASQASASAAVRNAWSTSAAWTLTRQARIETEFGKPAHRHGARFNFGEILPDPDHRPPRGHAPCKPCDKAGRRGALPSGFRKHLVHRAQGEPALQACIGLGMSERAPGAASAPRHAPRGARCCRVKSQACSCVRSSCAPLL